MSVITEAETGLNDFFSNVEGWFEDAKPHVAKLVDEAKKGAAVVEGDPFVKAYLGAKLAIPAHLIDLSLDFLGKLAQVDVSSAAPPAPQPPVETPAPDAQPDAPADPDTQPASPAEAAQPAA